MSGRSFLIHQCCLGPCDVAPRRDAKLLIVIVDEIQRALVAEAAAPRSRRRGLPYDGMPISAYNNLQADKSEAAGILRV